LPNGQLELSATTLDSSNLDAHAAILQAHGYDTVSFALLTSHEYGAFRSHTDTTDRPIELVIADRVKVYDTSLEAQTGRRHNFGRVDDTIDAHEFFDEYCDDYWAGYKAYHELLAKHLGGHRLHDNFRDYLLRCMDRQEQVGQSVLTQDKIDRLRIQLLGGRVTPEMAMSCRELLVYDHHATLSRLLKQYNETGLVDQLNYNGSGDFMDAYAEAASSNGSAAAANGETFAGCETATGVNSLATAAQVAGEKGLSLEQVLRMQDEEAMHCLRIQLYGYTIRKGVQCPFCEQKVDARDSTAEIECLDCGKVLNKASGKVSSRRKEKNESEASTPERPRIKLRTGQHYTISGQRYRREQHTVVGGAEIFYINPAGVRINGVQAERLDAVISQQISVETQAA
jgi:ribosomal protein L37AE/L43A